MYVQLLENNVKMTPTSTKKQLVSPCIKGKWEESEPHVEGRQTKAEEKTLNEIFAKDMFRGARLRACTGSDSE